MSKQRGFTLLELMTTISVVALLVSIGLPSMTSVVRSNRIVADTNELVATIYMARSEAMNDVVQVTICKSSDQVNCDNGASWQDGWIVFADTDEDEVRDLLGTPETLIYAHEKLSGSNTLQSASFGNWIAFRPNGMAIGSTANAGVFSLCHSGSSYGRDISVNRTGSPSVAQAGEGSC
jgi:type IV fimbrial biogenesis protein FimT